MTMTNAIPLITPSWPAPPTVNAFSTTRIGGFSNAPYDSLNLGVSSHDDLDTVNLNRQTLINARYLPSDPCWLTQVHETRVLNDEYDPCDNRADGIVSRTPGRVCVVMTADCLPILLYGAEHHEVAAIHSGWRSLAKGIVPNTLSQLRSHPDSIMVWLGPCIGPTSFEVGDEVREEFSTIDDKYEAAFTRHGMKWLADLKQLAIHQLQAQGVTAIYRDNSCTFNDKERFFSYRRDKTTGRMGSFIWLNDDNKRGNKT